MGGTEQNEGSFYEIILDGWGGGGGYYKILIKQPVACDGLSSIRRENGQ